MSKCVKIYVLLCLAIITTSIAMEVPKKIKKAKKSQVTNLPPLSLIEFFSNIEKSNYNKLPSDLKKKIVDDVLVPQLINKPWHYVEHKIDKESFALRFTPDKILLVADETYVNWFDYQKKEITTCVPYHQSHASVCFDAQGHHIAVISNEGGYIADLSQKKPGITITDNHLRNNSIISACFNHDNSMIIVMLSNSHMLFYDIKTGQRTKSGMYGYVNSVNQFCSSSVETKNAIMNDKNKIIIGDDFSVGRVMVNKYCTFKQEDDASLLCFNHDATLLAAGLYNGKLAIFDADTGRELWSLLFKKWVRSFCFDALTNRIAVGLSYSSTYIIAHYDQYTLEQLLLRKIIHLWLQLKKPNHKINSLKRVFKNISLLLRLDKKELCEVWNTFPDFMKVAIEETVLARINMYKHERKKLLSRLSKK